MLGHALIAWRHPAFRGWKLLHHAITVIALNTVALPPVFRLFGVGRGSMTPASPKRKASLFTCPRSLTGGFSFCRWFNRPITGRRRLADGVGTLHDYLMTKTQQHATLPGRTAAGHLAGAVRSPP